jgi:uncharacterized membrane protein YcjF (UPF0283 family)
MKRRLKNVTCSVDNSCPKAYASGWHKRPNRKKLALERDRKMLVEQDNRLLLQRISDIMQVRSRQTVSVIAVAIVVAISPRKLIDITFTPSSPTVNKKNP